MQWAFNPDNQFSSLQRLGNPTSLLGSLLEKFGGKLQYFAFSHGEYGALAIIEFDSEDGAGAAAMAISSIAKPVRALSTVLISANSAAAAAARAASVTPQIVGDGMLRDAFGSH